MSTAELILEYIKALAWPSAVLVLVLYFRSGLRAVLFQLADRLRSAESVKFGVMGQEIELSGTARELLSQRPGVAEPTVKRLNSPIADTLGIALLETPSHSLPEDELLPTLARAMGMKVSKAQQAFVAAALLKEIEPIVRELSSQGFVILADGKCALTRDGISFFTRVRENQQRAVAMLQMRENSQSEDIDSQSNA